MLSFTKIDFIFTTMVKFKQIIRKIEDVAEDLTGRSIRTRMWSGKDSLRNWTQKQNAIYEFWRMSGVGVSELLLFQVDECMFEDAELK